MYLLFIYLQFSSWRLLFPIIVMFSLLRQASVSLHDSLDDGSIADAIAFGMGNEQSPLKGFKLGRSLTDDLNPEAFKVRKRYASQMISSLEIRTRLFARICYAECRFESACCESLYAEQPRLCFSHAAHALACNKMYRIALFRLHPMRRGRPVRVDSMFCAYVRAPARIEGEWVGGER